MAYLTLNQLLQLANLSDEVKNDALANLDKMNKDQKFRLSQICWESIAKHYENDARFEYERMLEEMAGGHAQYGPDAFALIEDRVLTSLLEKIEGLQTKEQLASVQEELRQHLENPAK